MTPPDLRDAIPATWRRRLYVAYALLTLALGGTQVGYSTAQMDQPMWLTVAMSVAVFVGAPLGLTAATFTPTTSTRPTEAPDEMGG